MLRLYPGDGHGGKLGGYKQLATSWSNMSEIFSPGDFDGDAKPDIIGRYSTGELRLYRGDGVGGPLGGYTSLKTGWNDFDTIG